MFSPYTQHLFISSLWQDDLEQTVPYDLLKRTVQFWTSQPNPIQIVHAQDMRPFQFVHEALEGFLQGQRKCGVGVKEDQWVAGVIVTEVMGVIGHQSQVWELTACMTV